MQDLKNLKHIVTHGDDFQEDEVIACAILNVIYDGKITITRLPHNHFIKPEGYIGHCDFMLDVGQIYDHLRKLYDHHQRKGRPRARQNNVPYSAAGLIWKHYGHELIQKVHKCTDEYANMMWEVIDRCCIQYVCAQDCGYKLIKTGVPIIELSSMSSKLYNKMPGEDRSDLYDIFIQAVEAKSSDIRRMIKLVDDRCQMRKKIVGTMSQQKEMRYVVFKEVIKRGSFEESIHNFPEFNELLFVAYLDPAEQQYDPSKKQRFRIKAINTGHDTPDMKKPLPRKWQGVADEDMPDIVGHPDAGFCTVNGYMAAANSLEGAEFMIQEALK